MIRTVTLLGLFVAMLAGCESGSPSQGGASRGDTVSGPCTPAELDAQVERFVTYIVDWIQVGFNASSDAIKGGGTASAAEHAQFAANALSQQTEVLTALRRCFAKDAVVLRHLDAYETSVKRLLNREPHNAAELMATWNVAMDASEQAEQRMLVLTGGS